MVYYKCDKQETFYDLAGKQKSVKALNESDDLTDISYAKYKEMLVNSIKDVIEILGFDVEKDLLSKNRLSFISISNRM